MELSRLATGRSSAGLGLVLGCVLAAAVVLPLSAQQRRYFVELGAGGAYQTFDEVTNLGSAFGGLGRIGFWLPANFSVEAEASFTKPDVEGVVLIGDESQNVTTITGSLLYNARIGQASFFYLKGSVGSTNFGDCPPPEEPLGAGPCGSSGVVGGGLGLRLGLTPTLMLRTEGVLDRSTSGGADAFTNFRGNVGLTLMLGSRPLVDSDRDGVLDGRDRCPETPAGAVTDSTGCPSDADGDEVFDGIDRCPDTPEGVVVDRLGCPRDSDRDGVADGIDRCDDTPPGSDVDETGCQRDNDKDGVPDGLDRCAETPEGATVDQLGCPGDEDADGVLDGLDRCPRTPSGVTVNAFGCPPGETGQVPEEPAEPAAPNPASAEPAPDGPIVLQNVTFALGSARLEPGSRATLDSVAAAILANPSLRWEVAGHTDDTGNAAANLHLSTLRAEAVRSYLISRGVPFQWLSARGYGSSQPRARGTSPTARAANRRVELRPRSPEP